MSSCTRRGFVKAGLAGVAGLAIGRKSDLSAAQTAAGRQLRVAVIGGGVAGLTAAHTLKQLGYSNVTVYEKSPKPGGKVLTDRSLGGPVEMGAVFATSRYDVTLQLAREVGAATRGIGRASASPILDDDGSVVPAQEFAIRKHGREAVERAVERYAALAKQHRLDERRGFAGASAELHVPFSEFASKNEIVPFADLFRSQIVAYGAPYYETVPAMYYLKGIDILTSDQYVFPGGYQDLWARVAQPLDVRCSADVSAVRRRVSSKGPRIELQVNGEEQVFDRLVVATPCGAMSRYLDLTPEERDLLAQVKKNNYQVTVARLGGAPSRGALFSHPSSRPEAAGHVAAWYRAVPPQPIYAAYQNVGATQSDAVARRLFEDDCAKVFKGPVEAVLLHQKWDDYFEHVEPAALARGFYDRFEALQGKNGTCYATGLLALEGVETCARYARDIVREMFPPVPTT